MIHPNKLPRFGTGGLTMREILFRGKRKDNGEWVEGSLISFTGSQFTAIFSSPSFSCTVDPSTVGQYTGLTDKNGTKIFEGDIVQYNTLEDFDCQSVVRFGKYEQDGSSGEYAKRNCIGFFVEVENFTCPDWCENEPERFPEYLAQQNILEIASKCEVIGNIYDNPELLEGGNDNG